MKLFHRFFLILLAFSMVPVAGMGLWMLSTRQAVQDNARFLHGRLAALVGDSAERMLEQVDHTLGVAQDLEIAHGQEKIEIPALRRAASMDPEVALISVLDSTGVETERMTDPEIYPDQTRVDRSSETVVAEARKSGVLGVGTPVVVAGRTLVPVVHPLTDGRALYLMYSVSGLQRRLKTFTADGRGRVLFVDETGRPIPGLGSAPPTPDWRLPGGGDEDGWWDRLPSPDGPWVAASAPVATLGWRAVSLQPRRDAYAESDAAAASAVAFFLVLCALVAGGAFALSKRLLRPVTALVAGAERVARDDFSKPIPALGWGELDGLGRTFNAMAEKVRHYRELQVDRLLEEKAKVDALVRNIPGGVLLVGLDGALTFANAAAVAVLGLNLSSGRGELPPKFPEIKRIIDVVRRGAKLSEEARIEMRAANGETIATFSCRALPVRREGRDVGVLVLMREVTAELELERMKDEFFHSIVHDLRGPITVIDGMVQVMKKMTLDERTTRYVEMARKASERLADLIKNILDIAKFESGTMSLNTKRFTADSLLAGVHDINRLPAEGKGVTLDVERSAVGELIGDTVLLDRVLMNLIGNALKFTPSGGRITLAAAAIGAEVEFSVRDTGPGIPADKVDAVFEKFKQLDRDAAARSGYGLGLSICKKIVEAHGGRIWVESVEGQGSRFIFRVPRDGPRPA
jgi:signal transduction histidine kinase